MNYGTAKGRLHSGPARALDMNVTGLKELDKQLLMIVAEEGAKSLNAELRKSTRQAVKEIIRPEVMARVPSDSGFLESQIVVRAIKRSRGKIGYYCGFSDPLFQGDTFYGGFIEFGFTAKGGVTVEADSFLRAALYPNASRVIAQVRDRLRSFIAARNRAA